MTLDDLIKTIEDYDSSSKQSLESVKNLKTLDGFKVHWLGKKGKISLLMRSLGKLSKEEKPQAGQRVNVLRTKLLETVDGLKNEFEIKEFEKQIKENAVDVTLPGKSLGSLHREHPVSWVEDKIVQILSAEGFTVRVGPEIENEFYNFDALNIPKNHPARQMQDTFYLKGRKDYLLRTHTSPVQIRSMLKEKPPIRMICPGRVYRSEHDATHTAMFHQIEGLLVDKDINMAHLKGILKRFLTQFFEQEVELRLRPSYFPFTEPSAEIDVRAKLNGQTRWLEVGGCGMVDPEVFKTVEIDSNKYKGFAFGFGLDRLAMLKFGVDDLRLLFEIDSEYLEQFSRWRI